MDKETNHVTIVSNQNIWCKRDTRAKIKVLITS